MALRSAVLVLALAGCDALLRLTPVPPPKPADAGFDAPTAHIAYVQSNFVAQPAGDIVDVPFLIDEGAGDFNVVIIGWDQSANVAQVTDNHGDTYQRAGSIETRQMIYYAANIAGGTTTVTVTFAPTASYPDIRIAEYAGITSQDPLDGYSGMSRPLSSGTNMESGAFTTTNNYDLLVAGTTVGGQTVGFSLGFSQRQITPFGDIVEDMIVTAAGSYNATAVQDSEHDWSMQMVAFKGALTAP